MREKKRFLGFAIGAIFAMSSLGCSNTGPDDALDEFQSRKEATEAKEREQTQIGGATADQEPKCFAPDYKYTENDAPDNACTDTKADNLGIFLGIVDTTIAPGTPLLFRVEITKEDGKQRMALKPLHKDTGMVIDQELKFDVLVSNDGTFQAKTGQISVVGLANAISGSDIRASLVLAGQIRNDNYLCGAVAGCLIEPFTYDLIGSTFTMTRVADDAALLALFESTKDNRALKCVSCADSGSSTTGGAMVGGAMTPTAGGDMNAGGMMTAPTGGSSDSPMGGAMSTGGGEGTP